jgi:Glycosyl hydrolase family 47
MSPLRAWPSAARVFLYRLPTRIIFCVILLFFLFSTLLSIHLPPELIPSRLAHAVHFLPEQYRPTVTPPSPASNRHRIKPQRPLADHRKGDVWARRADVVRSAFLDAYNSYVTYAAPHDELRPLSKTPSDKCVLSASLPLRPLTFGVTCSLNGWSLSYIDSLDTLWLMGLHEEFDDALAVVANITFSMPSVRNALTYALPPFSCSSDNECGCLATIRPILRNRHPISWRVAVRICPIKRPHPSGTRR